MTSQLTHKVVEDFTKRVGDSIDHPSPIRWELESFLPPKLREEYRKLLDPKERNR